MTGPLAGLGRCFLGITPSVVTTCASDGTPNATFLSQVFYVDPSHVALSCQFFNKTRRNLDENPRASLFVVDPLTMEGFVLGLVFVRSELEGALFDAMALRIQAIASQTGMAGVFRLLSADVFRVETVRPLDAFLGDSRQDGATDSAASRAALTDLHRLQLLSERLNQATDLDALLRSLLHALDELFGFSHAMVLVPGDSEGRLVTLASHGYGDSGIGAEVSVGDGLIGTVAEKRQLLRLAGAAGLRYARAIRGQMERDTDVASLPPEIPLPGLANPQSQLALPLVVRDRLVGVLAVESEDPLCFEEWHEPYLQIIANQIAIGIESFAHDDGALDPDPPEGGARTRSFCFYRNDDCVFVDGEYLVRNIPGKILWKLLRLHVDEGRVAFTNRELRLNPSLGLPKVKDNLESRLILLRRRLEAKCHDVRIVPTSRGRFALEVDCAITLTERDSA